MTEMISANFLKLGRLYRARHVPSPFRIYQSADEVWLDKDDILIFVKVEKHTKSFDYIFMEPNGKLITESLFSETNPNLYYEEVIQ